MKLRVGIKCNGWGRPEYVEIVVPDTATEDEKEDAMRDAAVDVAGFEFWLDRKLESAEDEQMPDDWHDDPQAIFGDPRA